MKRFVSTFSIALFSLVAFCQNSPESIIKDFFDAYQKNPGKAIDNLYVTNPWVSRSKDAVENLRKEINGLTIDYVGKYYGNELIVKKQLSESFVLYSYLVKYDRQPIRFTFEFYKPNDKWMVYSFNFDSKIDDEIEEAAKIYNLNLGESKY